MVKILTNIIFPSDEPQNRRPARILHLKWYKTTNKVVKQILVPVDFSQQSVNAFRFAVDIASKSRGQITLLNIIALPVLRDTMLMPVEGFRTSMIDELKSSVQQKFDDLVRTHNTARVRVDEEVIISNRIHDSILKSIVDGHYDLVVMGTKGVSGIREWTIGSNTERIVRTSPVPVISVKDYTPAATIHDIVFPNALDSENQEELVMRIKVLQDLFKATLHIIRVNTPAMHKDENSIREDLGDFAKRYLLKDYTLNVFDYSSEEAGIMEFTKQSGADMIAMGTHGVRGLAHFFSGSIAEDVVNHVPYPVWTWSEKAGTQVVH